MSIDPINPEDRIRLYLAELRETVEMERAKAAKKCQRIALRHLPHDHERQAIACAWREFEDRTRVLQTQIENITALLVRSLPPPEMRALIGNPTMSDSVVKQRFLGEEP